MNEQRAQAYGNLIKQLFDCNNGDEPRILQENRELVDEGLVEFLIMVARTLEETGREDESKLYMNLAQGVEQLVALATRSGEISRISTEVSEEVSDSPSLVREAQPTIKNKNIPFISLIGNLLYRLGRSFIILLSVVFIGIPLALLMLIFPSLKRKIESLNSSSPSSVLNKSPHQTSQDITTPIQQDYFNFLMEVLEKVAENPSRQLIYPFLAQNLDKLDENLINILDNWEKTTFFLLTAETAEQYLLFSRIIGTFADLIEEFPLGNIAINKDIAIAGYETTLIVFTFDSFPQEWAAARNNLACAYFNRIRGDKAENLERVIASLTEVLKVYTFDAFPLEWARTQHNLSNAYLDRIRGDEAENLEHAITACTEALKVRTFDAFPEDWAATQNNLANAYSRRIRGDKADNLEMAITAYTEALTVYTFDAFPKDWAMVQYNLANIYSNRIRGGKAENLERAIAAFNEALKVYTFDAFPKNWAMAQSNLAGAYCDRIRGDRANNLERAIASSTEALKVHTFDAFPQDWAYTQNNLGYVYSHRIRGDRADNLERAIAAFNEALKVHTFDAFPKNWAAVQNNLAGAYGERIRRDRSDNLEMAIAALNEALKVHTFDAFPQDWASTQNSLANIYSKRIRGDRADNLEMAIAGCREALKVLTFEAFPQDWAKTQHNLALAYVNRIRGDKAENLEQAIATYHEALKVRTFDAFPEDWAATQNNLANAYFNRIRGDRADNLEVAIAACTEALTVYTFDAFPRDWAYTQNNLGYVYSHRIRGDRADNLERAIAAYYNALKIFTKENEPLNCLQTAYNLASLHYDQKQWQPASAAYHIAIEALENARLEALNPQSRQETLSNAIYVFHDIVQAHLKLNQPEKALEYIERSKTRNLVELMTQKNVKPQRVSQKIIDQLDELRQKWVNEQIRLQSRSINQNISSNDKLTPYISDDSHLKEYRQAWEDFIDEKITPIDPKFKLTQIVQPITFKDIQALTDAETCLLQWYITREKILAFVVSSVPPLSKGGLGGVNIKYWESSETDLRAFFDATINYLQFYYSENGKQEWSNQLSNLLQTFADTLHLNDIVALIPNTCKRLIIIPYWFLHILPLHALPINDNRWAMPILQDKYDVQYAPSCQLLQITKQRQLNELTNLFAIQNPTKDLTFTDLEVNIISTLFNQSEIIAKDHATKDNVTSHLKASDSHCHHFSCHGGFNPGNSLDSALLLANKELLTLGEIFELNFKKSRLVVLSACETGLIDLNSISDEYIGLPSGFLFAGSPSVVSSLWTVNDLSTSFLMIKFYEILFDENQQVSVPVALKQAQYWLQDLTIDKLDEFLQQYQPQIDKHLVQLRPGQRKIYQKSLERIRERQPYPFANPYYWAGFTATGI
ncbi:MAG: tetratricopeptide repeat protein [Microcystis aeruginosa LL11-07]|nr:tetratricopeptide repeat protein [Microcystis aeruginosa LL11-07]